MLTLSSRKGHGERITHYDHELFIRAIAAQTRSSRLGQVLLFSRCQHVIRQPQPRHACAECCCLSRRPRGPEAPGGSACYVEGTDEEFTADAANKNAAAGRQPNAMVRQRRACHVITAAQMPIRHGDDTLLSRRRYGKSKEVSP